jgi:hypothetical protein
MVVACTRDLSALITFNANSFIGAPFVWADRVLPLPYPSLSRQLYAELVCHLCPKGDTGQLLLDYGFMVSTRALAVCRCPRTLRAMSLIQFASLTALAANRNCASWLTNLQARSNDGPITALPAEHFLA